MSEFQNNVVAITADKFQSLTELAEHIADHLDDAELSFEYTDSANAVEIIMGMMMTAAVCLQVQLNKLYRYSEGSVPLVVTPMPEGVSWVKGGAILEFTHALSRIHIKGGEEVGEPLNFTEGLEALICDKLLGECLDAADDLCEELINFTGNDHLLDAIPLTVAVLAHHTMGAAMPNSDISTIDATTAQALNAVTIYFIEMMAEHIATQFQCPQCAAGEEHEHHSIH